MGPKQRRTAPTPWLGPSNGRTACWPRDHAHCWSSCAVCSKLYPDNEPLSTNLAYLKKRRAQLQYPRFRQQGWPIGSGMVESANKLVVEARLKGAGMHWQRGHVDAMLALRNLLCNDRWEQEWPHIKARLVAQAQHRRFPACQKRLQAVQMQEREAALAAQHAQYVALHPEWLADPQPDRLTRLHHQRQDPPNPPPTIPGAVHPSAKPDSSNFQNPDAPIDDAC